MGAAKAGIESLALMASIFSAMSEIVVLRKI